MENLENRTGATPEENMNPAAAAAEAGGGSAPDNWNASEAIDEFHETMADLKAENDAVAVNPEESGKKGSELMAWIKDIVIAVILALIIYQFITPTIVQEHSMENTLNNNDYLILWKLPYTLGQEPDYGDIIVFKSDMYTDNGSQKLLIKRVIGRGGDTVAVREGVVYRNGEALDEPYTKDGYTSGAMDETVVPEGDLFVLGDNRAVSVDSRSPEVGFVESERVVGKAVLRLFPFSQIGGIYGNYVDSTAEAGE